MIAEAGIVVPGSRVARRERILFNRGKMTMRLPIYQVDAFTNRLFGGNPAAVVVVKEWLPDQLMQDVASENNLSETAFVIADEDVSPLRWFTPGMEVDLCGHATMAAAHVLFRHYFPRRDEVAFSTRSGPLSVTRAGNILTLDLPARPGRPVEVDAAMVEALGVEPQEAYLARDLLAILDSEEAVRAFQPDQGRIAGLDAVGVIISAPGTDVDFVSRFFGPRVGVPEDPVTGSAHCTLIPYWAQRLGKKELTARQLSARGGELRCRLREERVGVGGSAVEYMNGRITVPVKGSAG